MENTWPHKRLPSDSDIDEQVHEEYRIKDPDDIDAECYEGEGGGMPVIQEDLAGEFSRMPSSRKTPQQASHMQTPKHVEFILQ
jgi:hypothetical protein